VRGPALRGRLPPRYDDAAFRAAPGAGPDAAPGLRRDLPSGAANLFPDEIIQDFVMTVPAPRAPLRQRHETRMRLLTVTSVADITPLMRRVRLTGELEGFVSLGHA